MASKKKRNKKYIGHDEKMRRHYQSRSDRGFKTGRDAVGNPVSFKPVKGGYKLS